MLARLGVLLGALGDGRDVGFGSVSLRFDPCVTINFGAALKSWLVGHSTTKPNAINAARKMRSGTEKEPMPLLLPGTAVSMFMLKPAHNIFS